MTTALQHLSQSALIELVLVQQQELIVKDDSIRVKDDSIRVKDDSIRHYEARVFDLEFQIKELQRLLFGAKRERFVSQMPASQLMLNFEANEAEVASAVDAELEKISYERKKPQLLAAPDGRTPASAACCAACAGDAGILSAG